jgi:hypothetical protein
VATGTAGLPGGQAHACIRCAGVTHVIHTPFAPFSLLDAIDDVSLLLLLGAGVRFLGNLREEGGCGACVGNHGDRTRRRDSMV